MTLSFGGGAGVLTIPGLASDGATPGGLVVDGAVTAGDRSAALLPTVSDYYGQVNIVESPGNDVDDDTPLQIFQNAALSHDRYGYALIAQRTGTLNGHQYLSPVIAVVDNSTSTADLQQWLVGNTMVATIGNAGGLGLFGHPAPAAPSTLPQATISAILDANAKTAVQALADCLAAIGVLTIT